MTEDFSHKTSAGQRSDVLFRPSVQPVDLGPSSNPKRFSTIYDSSAERPDSLRPLSLTVKRASTGSLDLPLSGGVPDPVVVHAGAVISMLHLVPAISCDTSKQVMLANKNYLEIKIFCMMHVSLP